MFLVAQGAVIILLCGIGVIASIVAYVSDDDDTKLYANFATGALFFIIMICLVALIDQHHKREIAELKIQLGYSVYFEGVRVYNDDAYFPDQYRVSVNDDTKTVYIFR